MTNIQITKELEEKIVNAQSDEEVIALFAEAGISVTPDRFHLGGDNPDSELNEADLDNVSGGSAASIVGWLIGRYLANRSSGGGHRF